MLFIAKRAVVFAAALAFSNRNLMAVIGELRRQATKPN
jgi:hypothetical protein